MVGYPCGALVLPDRRSAACHGHRGDPLHIGVGVCSDIGAGSCRYLTITVATTTGSSPVALWEIAPHQRVKVHVICSSALDKLSSMMDCTHIVELYSPHSSQTLLYQMFT